PPPEVYPKRTEVICGSLPKLSAQVVPPSADTNRAPDVDPKAISDGFAEFPSMAWRRTVSQASFWGRPSRRAVQLAPASRVSNTATLPPGVHLSDAPSSGMTNARSGSAGSTAIG